MNNNDLQHLLEDDRKHLDALSEVLQAERKSLELRDLENLTGLLQQKQLLLGKIEDNDYKRRQLLLKAGVPAAQTGLAQLKKLLGQGDDPAMLDLLESIEQRLSQCRELSETNSVIVHRSRLNTQRALDILRGPESLSDLYTSHGSTRSGITKRDLGNA